MLNCMVFLQRCSSVIATHSSCSAAREISPGLRSGPPASYMGTAPNTKHPGYKALDEGELDLLGGEGEVKEGMARQETG